MDIFIWGILGFRFLIKDHITHGVWYYFSPIDDVLNLLYLATDVLPPVARRHPCKDT